MPTKNTNTSEVAVSAKAAGVATLFEFTRSAGTQQVIIVSENMIEGVVHPPQLMIRHVSEGAMRRPWDLREAALSKGTTSAGRSADYLRFFSRWLNSSFGAETWEPKGSPITVEMSTADATEIKNKKSPQSLIGRITTVITAVKARDLDIPATPTTISASVAKFVDEVKDAVAGTDQAEDLKYFFENKRVSLGTAATVLSAFAFTSDSERKATAATYLTDRGRISVRASKKVTVNQEALDELSKSEEWYARPNGDRYYTRQWGEHSDVLVMRKAREVGAYVFLRSAPGTGKTALTEAAFGEDMYTLIGTGDTEVADLVGGYVQMPDGNFAWHNGPLVKAITEGKPFFIDEIGLIDPKVLAVVYGLMDGRKTLDVPANPSLGTLHVKDGFFVVSATNPKAPGVRLSEALLSRFLIHVEMTTDWGLARKLGVPDEIVTVAKNLAGMVEKGEITWAPQMRELLGYRDSAKTFGEAFAVANLLALAPESDRPVVADKFSRAVGSQVFPAKIAN